MHIVGSHNQPSADRIERDRLASRLTMLRAASQRARGVADVTWTDDDLRQASDDEQYLTYLAGLQDPRD